MYLGDLSTQRQLDLPIATVQTPNAWAGARSYTGCFSLISKQWEEVETHRPSLYTVYGDTQLLHEHEVR